MQKAHISSWVTLEIEIYPDQEIKPKIKKILNYKEPWSHYGFSRVLQSGNKMKLHISVQF